jgi:hypothetical protein
VNPQLGGKSALDTYKAVRKKFYEAADQMFGPGFFSMAEYYYMKKTGSSPFAILFSEPRSVYDEWVQILKGEEQVEKLIQRVAGPGYSTLLGDIRRNDGIKVWTFFDNKTNSFSLPA